MISIWPYLYTEIVEIDPAFSAVLSREKKLSCFQELANRKQKLSLHDVFAEAAETNLGSVTSFWNAWPS